MKLSDEMVRAFDERFKWHKGTIPELDEPELLIVFNYSPDIDKPLLSIAFDLSGGARCWLTARAKKIGDKGPNEHSHYKTFECEGVRFLPHSITSFGMDIFADIRKLEEACGSLYQYAVFG